MRILIAEDDNTSRLLLKTVLDKWKYDVTVAREGLEAWQMFQKEDVPLLAILDWMMPGLDGIELCRKIRETANGKLSYIIILTSRDDKKDIVEGLEAGADDYLIKPFNRDELRARIHVGERVMQLQAELVARVKELEEALAHVKQLQGLLPICAYCKRIRDDQDYWHKVEAYLMKYTGVQFSHGICPDCYAQIIEPQLKALREQKRK